MKLLTIAIPTYNRGKFLDKLLHSINTKGIEKFIEILIIDNASTDNTEEIIKKYNNILNIRYIKNKINIGSDNNFKKCIKEAKGKYIWLLGDDEILFANTIHSIVKVLKHYDDLGLIHLKAYNFIKEKDIKIQDIEKIEYKIFNNKENFFKKVHTNITFISSNIINNEILKKYINLEQVPNNNLVQVYWNMVCMIKAKKNLLFISPMYCARLYNSGSYEFCEVFCYRLLNLLKLLNKKYKIPYIINILIKRLLIFYYPANIIRIRAKLSRVKLNYIYCLKILFNNFYANPCFWLFTIPAFILPKKIGLIILKLMEKVK